MLNFLIENLRIGAKNLRLHKLRSLLTALGIIFGVAAVIIMVAIGQGAKQQARAQMNKLGATNILIRSTIPPASTDTGARANTMLEYGVKREDLARLQTLDGVVRTVPLRDVGQPVIVGDVRADARAIATTPDLFDIINLELDSGEFFNDVHMEQKAAVCVVGSAVAKQLFPFSDPVGRFIRVGRAEGGALLLKVIGVLLPTGLRSGSDSAGIMLRDIDQDIYFPMTLGRTQFGDTIFEQKQGSFEIRKVELSEVWLHAASIEVVEGLAARAEYTLGLPERQDAVVKAPIQILRNAERLNAIFNFIMVGIASFSLVVGGIGIMNIMLATVTERTREIGIRRALGAKRRHITLQFLIETTIISLMGGLIGIGIGCAIAAAIPRIAALYTGADGSRYDTQITPASVVASFVVSGLIGIGFGLYPAVKAARMNPIDALRHE